MGYLKAYYENFIRLSQRDWEFIAQHFQEQHFPKNDIITHRGNIEHYLSFVEYGIIRYYIPREENDITFHFTFDREFACAYDSFLSQCPSEYSLQALTETKIWQISYADLNKVYAQSRVSNYLGRFVAEKLYLAQSKRALSFLKHNAKERYLNLFDEQPEIIRYVPQKYIASYIGITPQALSRIRREIS